MPVKLRITMTENVRVAADVVLVNIALLAGLAVRAAGLAYFTAVPASQDFDSVVTQLWTLYRHAAPALTVICILTFAVSGFYTRGRFYASRYKLVLLVQSVSLAYLLFGFLTMFVPWFTPHPRSALVVGWMATLAAVVGARWWSNVWRTLVRREDRASSAAQSSPTAQIQNVLIIGGAGYIGSVTCRLLLQKGYRIRVLDALLYGDAGIRDLLSHPRFEFMLGDSRDTEAVVRSMRGIDAVVHLGEIVGDPATAIDHQVTQEINVAATKMLAETAKGFGVSRFVYASSCSVYGASDGILTEASSLNPISEYARAKVAAERILFKLNGDEFSPVILRLSTVFGLSPRPRFDLVVNVLTAKAVLEGQIPVSGGDQWRPFVHVRDVAAAILTMLESPLPLVRGRVFNVGGDELNHTITSAAAVIQRQIPEARTIINPAAVDKRNYRVSFARISRELNFKPAVSLEQGVRELADAIRAGAVGHYAEPHYSNEKTLTERGPVLSAIRGRRINELYDGVDRDSSPELAARPFEPLPVSLRRGPASRRRPASTIHRSAGPYLPWAHGMRTALGKLLSRTTTQALTRTGN